MDIHRPAFAVETVAPDFIEQLGAGKDNPLPGDEQAEQFKLLERQDDLLAVH